MRSNRMSFLGGAEGGAGAYPACVELGGVSCSAEGDGGKAVSPSTSPRSKGKHGAVGGVSRLPAPPPCA